MSNWLLKQFDITRKALLNEIEGLDTAAVDIQPDGFTNTIHWHIGHILTVSEQFLFGFPGKSQHLPENYKALFGNGTKPADWSDDEVPTVAELADQLAEQLERIKQIPSEQFEVTLDKPVMGQEQFGGLAAMAVFHEANHFGQIHAMHLAATQKK